MLKMDEMFLVFLVTWKPKEAGETVPCRMVAGVGWGDMSHWPPTEVPAVEATFENDFAIQSKSQKDNYVV